MLIQGRRYGAVYFIKILMSAVLAGVFFISCLMVGPMMQPTLSPRHSTARITEPVEVSAELKAILPISLEGRRIYASILSSRGEWILLTDLSTDKNGRVRLMFPPRHFPKTGQYFIGWRTSSHHSSREIYQVSRVSVTR